MDGARADLISEVPFPPLAQKAFVLGFIKLPSLEAMVPLDTVDLLVMDAAY